MFFYYLIGKIWSKICAKLQNTVNKIISEFKFKITVCLTGFGLSDYQLGFLAAQMQPNSFELMPPLQLVIGPWKTGCMCWPLKAPFIHGFLKTCSSSILVKHQIFSNKLYFSTEMHGSTMSPAQQYQSPSSGFFINSPSTGPLSSPNSIPSSPSAPAFHPHYPHSKWRGVFSPFWSYITKTQTNNGGESENS